MGEDAEYREPAAGNGLHDGDLQCNAVSKAAQAIEPLGGRPHNKGAQEQRQTYRGLGERDEHERGAAHVHEEPADPELVERVRLDHLRARTGAGTPRFVRAPAARSGAKAVWRRKGAGANTLSLRERGGRMRVPFFWRTLPMLLPAVPASVSATDSHISPPPAPIRSNASVRRASGGRDWGSPPFYFTRLFGGVEKQEQDHEGGREGGGRVVGSWQGCAFLGRAPVHRACSCCRAPLLGVWLVGSLLLVAGRVCGTGRRSSRLEYILPHVLSHTDTVQFPLLGLKFWAFGIWKGPLGRF